MPPPLLRARCVKVAGLAATALLVAALMCGPAPVHLSAALTQPTSGAVSISRQADADQAAGRWTGSRSSSASFEEAASNVADTSHITLARRAFSSFFDQHGERLEQLWAQALQGKELQQRGIVVPAGHASSLANAYVNLHVLRHQVGCQLPVTIM